MSMRTLLPIFTGLLAISVVLSSLAQEPEGPAIQVVDDPRLNESSGLALSLRTPGILWTHNDSGDGPFVFALDEKGSVRGRFTLNGAFNFDWEDMASGMSKAGVPYLYVGDIGDNLSIRGDLQIYRVEEPVVDLTGKGVIEREISAVSIFRASYPDGRHNAESLLCHPKTGQLFIITKTDDGQCGVYAFPLELSSQSTMTLVHLGDFRLPLLTKNGKRPIDNCKSTAACFSPEGDRVVVMSYSSLYEWQVKEGQSLGEALAIKPSRIETPLMPQGEAVCYSRDGDHFWCTSERIPAHLYRITK
jgi:hypothetical protein